MIPIGSLVRDVDQGDIGIIVGPLEIVPDSLYVESYRTQLVLWPSNDGEPMPMDMEAIENGWVEVLQ